MTTFSKTFPIYRYNDVFGKKTAIQKITVDEFMDYIQKNPHQRVELINGIILPMTGGTSNHSLIASNCLDVKFFLRKNKPNCKVYTSDFGVQTAEYQVRYPDFCIACGIDGEATYTSSPIIIGEVLSKSNSKKEIANKIDEYKNLHSVQEIVLISQNRKHVTIHRRGHFFGWSQETYTHGMVEYQSIGYSFDIEELYIDVDFNKN